MESSKWGCQGQICVLEGSPGAGQGRRRGLECREEAGVPAWARSGEF